MFDVVQKSESLLLVNFRGMVLPMTPDEYRDFSESLAEWEK